VASFRRLRRNNTALLLPACGGDSTAIPPSPAPLLTRAADTLTKRLLTAYLRVPRYLSIYHAYRPTTLFPYNTSLQPCTWPSWHFYSLVKPPSYYMRLTHLKRLRRLLASATWHITRGLLTLLAGARCLLPSCRVYSAHLASWWGRCGAHCLAAKLPYCVVPIKLQLDRGCPLHTGYCDNCRRSTAPPKHAYALPTRGCRSHSDSSLREHIRLRLSPHAAATPSALQRNALAQQRYLHGTALRVRGVFSSADSRQHHFARAFLSG